MSEPCQQAEQAAELMVPVYLRPVVGVVGLDVISVRLSLREQVAHVSGGDAAQLVQQVCKGKRVTGGELTDTGAVLLTQLPVEAPLGDDPKHGRPAERLHYELAPGLVDCCLDCCGKLLELVGLATNDDYDAIRDRLR